MPRAGYKPPLPYSKVVRSLWNDADFRELSPPPPNAQTLWLRLLTGPEVRAVPGLLLIGEAGLAEALDWPLEGFREAFQEIHRKGWAKANWKARLIWVPKAIYYNLPASPKVIRGWAIPWSELPCCDLKTTAFSSIKEAIGGMGEAFQEAFLETIVDPSSKPSGNQEQEQEQDKKHSGASAPVVVARKPSKRKGSPEQQACRDTIKAAFKAEYAKRSGGEEYVFDGAEEAGIVRLANLDKATGGTSAEFGLAALRRFIERAVGYPYYANNFHPSFISSSKVLNQLRLPLAEWQQSRERETAPKGRASDAETTAAELRKQEEHAREVDRQRQAGFKPPSLGEKQSQEIT